MEHMHVDPVISGVESGFGVEAIHKKLFTSS